MTETPNANQLRELAEDVGYELKMLAALGPLATPTGLPYLGYGVLEATLLHLRNLDEFLRADEAPEDDVIARHYLDSWPGVPVLTDDERVDINKQLMHVSQQRLRLSATWDRPALVRRALDIFGEFLTAVGAAHADRAEWFVSDFAEAQERFAHPVGLSLTP